MIIKYSPYRLFLVEIYIKLAGSKKGLGVSFRQNRPAYSKK